MIEENVTVVLKTDPEVGLYIGVEQEDRNFPKHSRLFGSVKGAWPRLVEG